MTEKGRNYLERIRAVRSKGRDEINQLFATLHGDRYVQQHLNPSVLAEYARSLEEELRRSTDESEVEYAGSLGFLLFRMAADQAAEASPGTANHKRFKDFADEGLEYPGIWKFLVDTYGLLDEDGSSMLSRPSRVSYHRTGTSSYILRIVRTEREKNLALKILQPYYRTVETIREATADYMRVHPESQYTPTVFRTGKAFVLMEFVEGHTLAERIENDGLDEPEAENLVLLLCDILRDLSRQGYTHGDLNPRNVILQRFDTADHPEVKLIDFGTNYLLTSAVGSPGQRLRLAPYAAPEVVESVEAGSILSDIYSLGVLILELEGGRALVDRRDFDAYLDDVRVDDPGLAAILDDVLDTDPDLRLFDLQERYGTELPGAAGIYADLKRYLDLEYTLRKKRAERFGRAPFKVLGLTLLSVRSGDHQIVKNRLDEGQVILDAAKAETKRGAGKWDYKFRAATMRLGLWAVFAFLSHVVVLIAFLGFGQHYWRLGDLGTAWMGLFTCLTFSFVATRYYIRVLSPLYVRDLGRFGFWTDVCLRFGAFYWPPAILLVYIFDPDYWFFAGAYGTAVVVCINWLCYRLGKRAAEHIRRFQGSVPRRVAEILREFGQWWSLMAFYSAGLAVVGALVRLDQIQDEWVYAVMAIILNFKLWWYNSAKEAPKIRGMLQYLFHRYRRARQHRDLQRDKSTSGE